MQLHENDITPMPEGQPISSNVSIVCPGCFFPVTGGHLIFMDIASSDYKGLMCKVPTATFCTETNRCKMTSAHEK